jgi:hypothetical protein
MTRQLNHVFPTLIGDVVSGPKEFQGKRRTTSVNIQMTSTMRTPVFWRNALGIVVVEPPTAATTHEEMFYVTIEYDIDPGVNIDSRELIDELNLPEKHVERKRIYEILTRIEREPTWQRPRRFNYTIGISAEQLTQYGGVVYLNDVDLVIGFEQYREAALHPYSPAGQRQTIADQTPIINGVQQQYLFVDNSGINGVRWVNTGFGVFELRAHRDPAINDGVYVTYGDGRYAKPKTDFYPLEEAETALGLYLNKAQAESFGSPEERFKTQMKEIEQEITRDKMETTRLKQEAEREKSTLEEARHRREHQVKEEDERRRRDQEEREREDKRIRDDFDRQREKLKADRERFQFDMDMRKHDRKDQSDVMKASIEIGKTLLGIISVSLSIYALVKKNQKS